MPQKSTVPKHDPVLQAALRGELNDAQTRQLALRGPEAVTLMLLALAKRIAELNADARPFVPTPSTPSGMIPAHEKPAAPTRRKRPGAKDRHPGTRRPQSASVDRHEEHRLKRCPHCAGPVQRCRRTRTRIIEDIP